MLAYFGQVLQVPSELDAELATCAPLHSPPVQVAESRISEEKARPIQDALLDIAHVAEELDPDGAHDPDQMTKLWDCMTQIREKAKQGLALIEPRLTLKQSVWNVGILFWIR